MTMHLKIMNKQEIQHWIDRWKKLKPSIVRDAVIKMWSKQFKNLK
jgi:hypothetical protein